MRFIPFSVNTGLKNMQVDSDLLDDAIRTQTMETTFRLYGWSPKCISLGRNQKEDFVDRKFLEENNIDLVKRLTGGRALLHDMEITYSYVCSTKTLENGENVAGAYKEISQIFIDKFKQLGIELEFGSSKHTNTHINYCMLVSTGADLCYKGKKIIGSAQFRKEGYILQHGSILLDYDRELLSKIFKEDVDTNSITSIKEINENITQQDILNLWEQ